MTGVVGLKEWCSCWNPSSFLFPCFTLCYYLILDPTYVFSHYFSYFLYSFFLLKWHELREPLTVPIAPQVIARHVCTAEHWKTHSFFWVSTLIPSCPLSVLGWMGGKTGSSLWSGMLLFCSPHKGWKTTFTHHSCTHKHGHICTQ